jgi:hypothetical protein
MFEINPTKIVFDMITIDECFCALKHMLDKYGCERAWFIQTNETIPAHGSWIVVILNIYNHI